MGINQLASERNQIALTDLRGAVKFQLNTILRVALTYRRGTKDIVHPGLSRDRANIPKGSHSEFGTSEVGAQCVRRASDGPRTGPGKSLQCEQEIALTNLRGAIVNLAPGRWSAVRFEWTSLDGLSTVCTEQHAAIESRTAASQVCTAGQHTAVESCAAAARSAQYAAYIERKAQDWTRQPTTNRVALG